MGSYIDKDTSQAIRHLAKKGYTNAYIMDDLGVPAWAVSVYSKRYLECVDGVVVKNFFFRGYPVPISWDATNTTLYVCKVAAAHACGYTTRFRSDTSIPERRINGANFIRFDFLAKISNIAKGHRANLVILLFKELQKAYYSEDACPTEETRDVIPERQPESSFTGKTEREVLIQKLELETEKQKKLLKVDSINEEVRKIEAQQNALPQLTQGTINE